MLERLIDAWLDSASERTYQIPFCQMLAAQGHTVFHSTRHSPIEFGKDILTIAPDGVPCAFQLKGNPGSRLTAKQLREIQGQLIQLATQPIVFPGIPSVPHRPYLVTNGQVEEEAQRIVDDLNRGFAQAQIRNAPIEIYSRGHLERWALDLGVSLWPTELEDINFLLSLLTHEGRSTLPLDRFHRLLWQVLGFDLSGRPSIADIRRRVVSAALLTSVAMRNFSLAENHFAVLTGWVLFCAYAIAICEKAQVRFAHIAADIVALAKVAVFDSLCDLCEEMMARKHMVEGNSLADAPFFRGRFTLLTALMCVFWFWCEEKGWPSDKHKGYVEDFVPREGSNLWLWGEGAVPQWLIYIWYLRRTGSTPRPDLVLAELLRVVVSSNTSQKRESLAGPYFTLEDVVRHYLRGLLRGEKDPLEDETLRQSSFSAEGLLHLLARTGLKQACKSIWPSYSKLSLRRFKPEASWQYCLWRSKWGEEIMKQSPLTETWENVTQAARDINAEDIPPPLREDQYILMLFVILLPYRATPSVVRYLGRCFNKAWFLLPPIGAEESVT